MSREKSKPPIRKPVFDEEIALRFAALETATDERHPAGHRSPGESDQKPGKKGDPVRIRLSLMLKAETISRLEEEAARKEKTMDQVVDKLVAKHLGKH